MRKELKNIVKILQKGPREGKYVNTPSGRRVYIKDNGSAYIEKTRKEDE